MTESTMVDEIASKGRLVYSNSGTSMMPLIKQGRDLVVIVKPEFPLKAYDVPLYRRGDSTRFVLHRILKVTPDGYVIRGDNCLNKEYGIKDDDIIGVLSAVIRKGKEISVDNTGYKIYSRVWRYIFPVRFFYMKARAAGGKIKRKLKGNRKT